MNKNHAFNSSETPDDAFNFFLQSILSLISKKNLPIRVLIVPSFLYDINAMPYFPTPSYELSDIIIDEVFIFKIFK